MARNKIHTILSFGPKMYWFFTNKLSNFVSPFWKLGSPFYHFRKFSRNVVYGPPCKSICREPQGKSYKGLILHVYVFMQHWIKHATRSKEKQIEFLFRKIVFGKRKYIKKLNRAIASVKKCCWKVRNCIECSSTTTKLVILWGIKDRVCRWAKFSICFV